LRQQLFCYFALVGGSMSTGKHHRDETDRSRIPACTDLRAIHKAQNSVCDADSEEASSLVVAFSAPLAQWPSSALQRRQAVQTLVA
jgi:hypothetical protein